MYECVIENEIATLIATTLLLVNSESEKIIDNYRLFGRQCLILSSRLQTQHLIRRKTFRWTRVRSPLPSNGFPITMGVTNRRFIWGMHHWAGNQMSFMMLMLLMMMMGAGIVSRTKVTPTGRRFVCRRPNRSLPSLCITCNRTPTTTSKCLPQTVWASD